MSAPTTTMNYVECDLDAGETLREWGRRVRPAKRPSWWRRLVRRAV